MIHLHYSNRLEQLIDPFADLVRDDQARDPLARMTVVVPGRAMQEFLKLRLAEHEGVAANLDFPFLRGFLTRIAEKSARGGSERAIKVLDAGGLQIAAFEYLREALAAARETDLAPLQSYLAAAHDDRRQQAVRLSQLSGRVAWLIREYSTARRTMLGQWPRGTALADDRLRATERWQRRIYLSLFEDDGSLRPAWIAPAPNAAHQSTRWMLLPFAFDAIDDRRLRETLPARLHVFGIGYAGPEFIRIFARLGALIDLHIYTLNPCREFWEDVRDRRAVRPPRVGTLIESAEDPFGLDSADESLALRYWGRAGREYIRLLNETTDCDFDEHFIEPTGDGTTLLRRVQQAILTRSAEQSFGSGGHPIPGGGRSAQDDGTIRILECPGVRREIEIAADAIWSLIRRDANTGGAPLRFHQIAVVIPETVRDRYMVHVEGVFAAAHRIPVNLVDRRLGAQSRVAEAVELLLRLPLGRFTRDEMIRLLIHPAIAGEAGEPHAQGWPEWCRRMGVHFGADERAFANTYVEPKLFHWDRALKQLALGVFMAGEPSKETRAFSADGAREYLPFEVSEDAAESVAIMVRKARGLIHDALAVAENVLGLADWRRVLIDLIATYVNPADRADERVRDLIVDALETIHCDGIRSQPVPYEVAQELALARIAEIEAEQGTYAESGVVVGSLAALRSIPFRVVFMLGLGEADFPAREPRDPLDLRQAHRRAGDVYPAERDRYMFLETLLAARDRIYLSYVARNAHTGEGLEPSAVIRDLQLILRGMVGEEAVKRLAITLPVHAHDRRYFADLTLSGEPRDERLETFDRNARRSAQMAALRADLDLRCGPTPEAELEDRLLEYLSAAARERIAPALRIVAPPPAIVSADDSRVRLSISGLRHYLECPLQGAARHALGLRDENDGDETESGDEPIALSRLDTTVLLRDALWRARGRSSEIAPHYDEEYRSRVLKGSAPVGPFAEAIRKDHLGRLETAIRQAAAAKIANLDRWQRIAVGGVEELIDVDCAIEPIILEVDFTCADGRRVTSIELHGTIGPVSQHRDKSIRLIAREARTADFLDGLFAAIVLAAAGETLPAEFTALVVGGKEDEGTIAKYTRSIHVPAQTEARDYLRQLASDLLCGNNNYFLPIEAVERVGKIPDATGDAIDAAVRAIRDTTPPPYCKSDFGPVRNARKFRVPLEEIEIGLIARRYGPLREMFASSRKGAKRARD